MLSTNADPSIVAPIGNADGGVGEQGLQPREFAVKFVAGMVAMVGGDGGTARESVAT